MTTDLHLSLLGMDFTEVAECTHFLDLEYFKMRNQCEYIYWPQCNVRSYTHNNTRACNSTSHNTLASKTGMKLPVLCSSKL